MFAFASWRIHFRNAWRYFLVEVVQKESADVEKGLWHVGTEGLILEKQSHKRSIITHNIKIPSNTIPLLASKIKYRAVQFFGFQGEVGFNTAISNRTLSQKGLNQMFCACPRELWWDILVSCSGFYHGDGSLLWGCNHRISRRLKQQTQKHDAGQVTPAGVITRNSLFMCVRPEGMETTPPINHATGNCGFRERSILTCIYLWTLQRALSTQI